MGNIKDENLYIRLVEHATTHYGITLVANLINASVLIYILRDIVPCLRLVIWFAVLLAIVAPRAIHAHYARFGTYSQARKIERINFFSLALTGTVWGLVSLFLFPENNLAYQTFIAFVLGGMVIGASVTTAALSNTYLAFSIPSLLPLIGRFFAIGTEITYAMGLMLIVFFGCFAFISRKLQLLITQTIMSTLEKEKEIKVRENVEKELRRHQERLELIVKERTEAISKSNGLLVNEIAERKKAEVALRQSHDLLEQRVLERTMELQKTHAQLLHAEKLGAIGGLSASIAHEFNNPLQGVMTVLKGVQRRVSLAEEDAKLVDMAVRECDRMKDLIKILQDFNRPSSGRMAPTNIHAIVDSLLLLSKKEYQTKGITVETNYAKDMPPIKVVADQIKQVILNLLNNAAHACEEEGGTITISTEAVSKESIVIKIQDTGRGIKPEHVDKIFDPFFTTKPEVKGTGLGLSISYGIIKNHGGKIDVESEEGTGTTLTITLPIEGVSNA